MGSKRGLSDVVTTVVIVALSLVAITVVWIVIQNIISSNTSTVNLQRDCLDIQLEVSLDENYLGPYDSGGYVKFFTIERVSGNVPFDGVKLIARNSKIGYEDAKYYPLNLSVGERECKYFFLRNGVKETS